MISLGPLPIQVVIILVALLIGWALARIVAKRLPDAPFKVASGMVLDALFVGLIAARLGYIALWWNEYATAPRSMIAIGDGGFSWWTGLLAALAFVAWRTRSHKALRRPVLAGITAGVLIWFSAGVVLDMHQRGEPPLPELHLTTLDARPIGLSAYAGRPIVVNLWASWCPPCRREMPVFQQIQAEFPQVAVVMINQGETAQQANDYLKSEGLSLKNVLLDPASQTMRAIGAKGLPTTLFFNAQGRFVDAHMGELTAASLKDTIQRRFKVK